MAAGDDVIPGILDPGRCIDTDQDRQQQVNDDKAHQHGESLSQKGIKRDGYQGGQQDGHRT